MGQLRLFDAPARAARFLEDRVGLAVGDIHGRADLLLEMLALLELRADHERRPGGEAIIVFLGDYVDRGPNSAAVLDLLLSGRPLGYERRFLKGNHEQSLLDFLDEPLLNRAWVLQGGAETMMSYGVQPPPPIGTRDEDWLAAAALLKERLPRAHVEFLRGLERYVEIADYAFVHAGVDPARPLAAQTDDALFWSRTKFLASKRPFSHRVVHGHTPAAEPFADTRRVGVDTGAYASGVLTAARFEGEEVSFMSVSERSLRGEAVF